MTIDWQVGSSATRPGWRRSRSGSRAKLAGPSMNRVSFALVHLAPEAVLADVAAATEAMIASELVQLPAFCRDVTADVHPSSDEVHRNTKPAQASQGCSARSS